MIKPLVLVVDDEPDILELIILTLEQMGVECIGAENVANAKQLLKQKAFSLCLTDMRLPDDDGIELVNYMQEHFPKTPVAVITAYGNMEIAINALKAGAFDFVSKPVNLQILRDLVDTALKLSRTPQAKSVAKNLQLLGSSSDIESIRAMTVKLGRSQAPVLINGESGTGKELVAKLIHEQGPRAEQAFVPVNCGAIPTELMESEFFGYKKGSFTGATSDKEGLFQAAHKGTLFLDEIAELPMHMQAKLLRAIQEKAIKPIGVQKEVQVDVRILSATHKDLQALIDAGEFRQDLYYRINVIQLEMPSLHQRPEDIPILIEHILNQLAIEIGVEVPELTSAALDRLTCYSFPGNVRELENILERAITLCEHSKIDVSDLHLVESNKSDGKVLSDEPLYSYLDNLEKDAIAKALDKHHWNRTAAAKELGITLRALRYRMQKLGL